MKKEEDKKKKIYRYLDNLYSKSEVEDILKDIQNPEMQREVNKISLEMWEESISKPPFLHHTEQEKYKQEARILLHKIEKKQFRFRKQVWGAIACIIILLISIISIKEYKISEHKHILFTEISTSFGEKKEYILPDGSKVLLNACSTIKFPQQFQGKNREIELNGEAYFEIVHDKKKKFLIKTDNFIVKVLGTKFNVKSYTEQETALVSVKSGKVEVELPQASMKLTANEQVQIQANGNEFIKKKEDNSRTLAWIQSKLYYQNATIYDITKDLEHYYNCQFKYSENQSFNNRISGQHDNKSLEAVLQSIEYITGIKYKIEGDTILLFK